MQNLKIHLFFLLFIANQAIAQSQKSYIFYWSNHQARLEAANNYHASWQVKLPEITKFLAAPPFLWDGAAMQKFSFLLEDIPLQTTDYEAYQKQILVFEEAYPTKIEEGEILHLKNIVLADGITGSIDIQILIENLNGKKEPKVRALESNVVRGEVENLNDNDIRVEYGVLSYRWGQHISNGGNYRHLMAISQFWESIKEMPALIRTQDFQREKVKAQLEVYVRQGDVVIYPFLLDSERNYNDFLEQITYQKRLFKPNTLVFCAFTSADSREQNLATHRIELVADDDPRLKLDEKEQKNFTFQWGKSMKFKKKGVYLKTLKKADDTEISADPRENITQATFSRLTEEGEDDINTLGDKLNSPFELFVNDKKIARWTCKVSNNFDDTAASVFDSKIGMTTELSHEIDSLAKKNGLVRIFDIRAEGFDFQPFNFRFFTDSKRYSLPKEKTILLGTPVANLDWTSVHIDYELTIGSIGNLKIVDENGTELWVKSGNFKVGKYSVVAENLTLEKGKKYKVVFALASGTEEKEIMF